VIDRNGRFALFALVIALAACAARPEGAPHGVVRFSLATDPSAVDPLRIHRDPVSAELELVRLSYEPFIDFDERGRPFPVLLRRIPTRENGDLSPDGRTLRYRLRPGVRWSDGTPLTAADVLFSLGVLRRTAGVSSGYLRIAGAEAPDAHTVVLHLRRAWAPAVLTFFNYGSESAFVAPAHPHGASPVVDGPFALAEWERGRSLRFRANDRYWRGKPASREIRVAIVASAQTSMMLLRTGKSDLGVIPPALRATLGNENDMRFVRTHMATVSGIAFNLRTLMRDPLLRGAIARSIDRAGLAARAGLGTYPPIETLQPYGSPLRDAAVRQPPFDPAAADALLDRAGWPRGRDGLRRRRGNELEVRYAFVGESPTATRVAVLVQAALRTRGVAVALVPTLATRFYDPGPAGTLGGSRFDLAYVTWPMGADAHDDEIFACAGAANVAHYCDGVVDALERRAGAAADAATRRRLQGAIEIRVARDLPILLLLENDYLFAYRRGVRGFAPNGFTTTWNAYRWSD
jgi:peptide/nickel transport system substrate-binding protein